MRIYELNEDYFEKLNTESAYWLGFLIGDGYISDGSKGKYTIEIGLKASDKPHLHKFAKCLGTNLPVNVYSREIPCPGYENAEDVARIQVNSKKLHSGLTKLGMGPRKSLTQGRMDIPLEFMPAFLRGIVDADGSIHFDKNPFGKNKSIGMNITGTKEMLLWLQEYINENVLPEDRGYLRTLKVPSGEYFQLAFSGNDCVLKILTHIYEGSIEDTRLDRKYELYMDFKNSGINIVPMRENYSKGEKSCEAYIIEAFGEEKTITEWAADERCAVSRVVLYHRLINMKMVPENAILFHSNTLSSSNVADGKNSNHQKATFDQVKQARLLHQGGKTVAEISDMLGLSQACLHDIISNKTFHDAKYAPRQHKTSGVIYIEYQGSSKTISEWAEQTGIAYSTIDRRWRAGLPVEQIFEDGRLNLGKAKSEKDLAAFEVARAVREDYQAGIIGKANYEKHGIPKSRYIDLIGNRTCKEAEVWWKEG